MKKWVLTILTVILVITVGSVSYCLWCEGDGSDISVSSDKKEDLAKHNKTAEKSTTAVEKESPYQFDIVNVAEEFIYGIAVYTQSGKLKLIYKKPEYVEKIVAVTETHLYYATTHNNVWRVPITEDEKVLQWEEQEKLFSDTVPIDRLLECSDSQCIYVTCNDEIVKKNLSSGKKADLSEEELKNAEQLLKQFPKEEYDKKLVMETAGMDPIDIPDDVHNPWHEKDEYKNKKLQTVAKSGVMQNFRFENTRLISDANVNSKYTYVADWDWKLTIYNKRGGVVKKSRLKNVHQIYVTDKYLYYTSGDYLEPRYEVWRCPLKAGLPKEKETELVWNMPSSVKWKNDDYLMYLFYATKDYIVCQDEQNRLYKYDIASGGVFRLPFSSDIRLASIMDCNNHPVVNGSKAYIGEADNLYELDMDSWVLKRLYKRNEMKFQYGQKCGNYILLLGDGEYEGSLYLFDEKNTALHEYKIWKELKNYFKANKVLKGEFCGVDIFKFYVYRNRIYFYVDISQDVPDKKDEDSYHEKIEEMFFSVRLSDGKDIRLERGMTKAVAKVNKDEYGGARDAILIGDKFLLKGDANFFFYSLLTGELYKKSVERCEKDADVQMSGMRPIDPNACHDGDEGEGDDDE